MSQEQQPISQTALHKLPLRIGRMDRHREMQTSSHLHRAIHRHRQMRLHVDLLPESEDHSLLWYVFYGLF